jgi:hypothetical protein
MDPRPSGQHWSRNVDIAGYCELDKKPAFKLQVQEVNGRWYLYVAHLWEQGWSIVDVTDVGKVKPIRFIKGPENTWCIQIQVADGKMITGLERIGEQGWGGDPDKPNAEGIYIWDASDPEDPKRVGHFKTGGQGTHRNYYDGGRYVHLTAAAEGYSGRIYRIVDIADPANPTEVGRWWVKGQWTAGGENAPPDVSLHGGPYIVGDRAYLPYRSAGIVILDISDYKKPQLISQLGFSPPFMRLFGIHTAMPFPDRKFITANSEAIREDCDEPLCFAGIVDISNEKDPRLISILPTPAPPEGFPHKNFCKFGGRFGPHNQHQWQNQKSLYRNDNLLFMTWFNAGLRIFDISDPLLPREVGYFVPPVPTERRGLLPKTLVPQSEDVVVDARGYIYVSDKNHGVYILKASDAVMEGRA